MRLARWILIFSLLPHLAHAQTEATLQTLKTHAMQYYVALPDGWSKSKKWPVVVLLEAAEKEYKANIERFIKARGSTPFILVQPIHTGNGNQGRRDPNLFPYDTKTWDYIDQVGDCKFNEDGIDAVMKDVVEKWNGEEDFFVTGFEAGTHLLWMLVFNHPERLKAAAPVAGNYRSRCVEEQKISTDAARIKLPIIGIVGENDEGFGPKSPNYNQWTDPKALAIKHGFTNIQEKILPGVAHVPMPDVVMDVFAKLH